MEPSEMQTARHKFCAGILASVLATARGESEMHIYRMGAYKKVALAVRYHSSKNTEEIKK
jgi:hypothetical protein